MSANCFIDSNVWLYLLSDDDKHKKTKAKAFLAGQPGDETFHKVISWQVMNEVCANLIRKKGKNEEFVSIAIDFLFRSCVVVDCTRAIVEKAVELRRTRSISFWDSLIVSTALASDCKMLVSEDMQDGEVFCGSLTVRNIFG